MRQVNKLDPALGHMHLHETFSLFKLKLILNGKCGVINSGPILALQCLFESDLNNGPSPSHSNLVSDGIYIYSGLLLMVSWWVPYLPKGCRPDLKNGLVNDSNSGPVLAPQRSFESDSNNGPSLGHPNLVSDEVYFRSSLLVTISGGYQIRPRAPCLTSIMA